MTKADNSYCPAPNSQRIIDSTMLNTNTDFKSSSFSNFLKSGLIANMIHFSKAKSSYTCEETGESRLITSVRRRKVFNKKMKRFRLDNGHFSNILDR